MALLGLFNHIEEKRQIGASGFVFSGPVGSVCRTGVDLALQPQTAQEAAQQIIDPIFDRAQTLAAERAQQEVEALIKKELDKQKNEALDSAARKLLGR